ncbi:MAG TPA: SDR family NAD(P)-dependent oxidoreductase [Pseudonocardia sp.]|nr:SDR family NAD(P)-dependent oxidoreductase [Pseudonocardia sp.]
MVDTILDRGVLLGYGKVGLQVRQRLPGWPADAPRLDGAVVLITGAGSGLGFAASAGYAALGASVRMLGRDPRRTARAIDEIRARVPGADVTPELCDLSDRADVRRFVREFTGRERRLDVLVNNAGVMPGQRRHTEDGIELTFATNVLAPWMLIEGLRPLLEAAAPSRVINVSSGGQYGQSIPAGDVESEQARYGPATVYARTKRELLVLTEHWAERLRGSGVFVHAMHPGWADTAGVRTSMPVFHTATRWILRTPEQGADTIVWLGGAEAALQSSGQFWHDRRTRPRTHPIGASDDSPATRDELLRHLEQLAVAPAS